MLKLHNVLYREQLYKSTLKFGLDYPLKMNDQGLYERIPHDALTKNSWREAFIPFYHSHHVVCNESQKKCEHVKVSKLSVL